MSHTPGVEQGMAHTAEGTARAAKVKARAILGKLVIGKDVLDT